VKTVKRGLTMRVSLEELAIAEGFKRRVVVTKTEPTTEQTNRYNEAVDLLERLLESPYFYAEGDIGVEKPQYNIGYEYLETAEEWIERYKEWKGLA